MNLLRALLGGCLWLELWGRVRWEVAGYGHEYQEQVDGSLLCERCGART